MLSKAVMGHKEIWDQLFAYNTLSHESTNYTPFEVMFGRKARIPIDADLESVCDLLSFCQSLILLYFILNFCNF